MRIILVHNHYKFRGGEDTYVNSLYEVFTKKGHIVLIYTKDNKKIKQGIFYRIKIAYGLFYSPKLNMEFTNIIKDFKPDIVHVNNVFPQITPQIYRVCKKFNIPVVQTVHNYRLLCPGGYLFNNGKECIHLKKRNLLHFLVHNCYRNSYIQSFIISLALFYHWKIKSFSFIDMFIFPAKFTMNIHRRYLKIPPEKSIVISYFLNKVLFPQGKKKNLEYFLYVGRLSLEKGIIDLLRVFSENTNYKLIVIGNGPLKPIIKKYKKYRNITYLPFISSGKILNYMRDAKCTIIPSKWFETGPIVMIESFSQGTPVIAPKIGVFEEAVESNKTGFLFKFNNIDDLKKVINNVKNKKISRSYIKENFKKKYTESKHYSSLIATYKQVISQKNT